MSTLGQGSNKGLGGSSGGLSKTSAGLIPLWETPEWAVANEYNDEGSRLVQEGEIEAGLELLSKSAHYGFPWALSSYTWQCLKSGEYDRGIREYNACIQACETLVEKIRPDPRFATLGPHQLANARSNTALLKLANGGPLEEARVTWEAGAVTGHTESQFYPALIAEKQGRSAEADAIIGALPPVVWFEARDILKEGIEEGNWFKEWCLAGLIVLERTQISVQIPEISELNSEFIKDLPRLHDQSLQDGIWEAVAQAVALDPAAEAPLRAFAEGGDATSWLARAELGCLLSTPAYSAAKGQEGQQLLEMCLTGPYRDIAAMAAWNLAEVMIENGQAESAAQLQTLALELGDGTALRVIAERLLADDQENEAVELFERAVAELPRGDFNRMKARAFLALRDCAAVPEDMSRWFMRQQGALSTTEWDSLVTLALWSGEFNVDSAQAAISTRYFEECPALCYYEPAPYRCGDCGRGILNFAHAASGRGDGGYNVFTLWGQVPAGEVESVGVFIPFLDEDIDGLSYVGRGNQFLDIIGSAAPLVLGDLLCNGELIVSDGSKCRDDADVSVRIEMPTDEYLVVCWLRPQADSVALSLGSSVGSDPLECVALMAVRGPLASLIRNFESEEMDASDRDELLRDIWGDEMRAVNSLMADIRPQILARMLDDNPNEESRPSFLLQMAERDDGGEDAIFALQNDGAVGSDDTLSLLAERGFVEPQLRWWQESMATESSDIWARVVQARSSEGFFVDDPQTENVWVRRALASRDDLSHAVVDHLIRDEDDRVRRNLAANSTLTEEHLIILSRDSDPAVVSAVAGNPTTPATLLSELTEKPASPKGALTENPRTPTHALGRVVDGGTKAVRETLAIRPDLPNELAIQLLGDELGVRRALASNTASSAENLATLAKDDSVWVRMRVAANPSASPETLIELSLDGDEYVREAVMGNPNAPEMAKAQAALLGATAAEARGEDEASESRVQVSAEIPVLTRAKFCPECGAPLEENQKFCVGCGKAAPEPTVTMTEVGPWQLLQSQWEIRGNFNVESGAAAFGTRIFDWCDCEGFTDIGQYCAACGRGAGNYVAVTAGAGDGVYPIFRLTDARGTHTGAVAFFEAGWAQGIEDESRRPADIIGSAKPIYAGTLTVDGLMYASEASAGWDCDYALVDVELPAGKYDVIAWQADMEILKEHEMEPYRRQIALGIYSQELVSALESVMPPDRRVESCEAMQSVNCGMHQVLSHNEPRWADACMYNAREDAERGEEDRSNSWLLQAARYGHQPAINSLPPNYLESMAPLDVARRARLLLMRGQRSEEPVSRSNSDVAQSSALSQPDGSGLTKSSPGLGGQGPAASSQPTGSSGLTKKSSGLGGKGL